MSIKLFWKLITCLFLSSAFSETYVGDWIYRTHSTRTSQFIRMENTKTKQKFEVKAGLHDYDCPLIFNGGSTTVRMGTKFPLMCGDKYEFKVYFCGENNKWLDDQNNPCEQTCKVVVERIKNDAAKVTQSEGSLVLTCNSSSIHPISRIYDCRDNLIEVCLDKNGKCNVSPNFRVLGKDEKMICDYQNNGCQIEQEEKVRLECLSAELDLTCKAMYGGPKFIRGSEIFDISTVKCDSSCQVTEIDYGRCFHNNRGILGSTETCTCEDGKTQDFDCKIDSNGQPVYDGASEFECDRPKLKTCAPIRNEGVKKNSPVNVGDTTTVECKNGYSSYKEKETFVCQLVNNNAILVKTSDGTPEDFDCGGLNPNYCELEKEKLDKNVTVTGNLFAKLNETIELKCANNLKIAHQFRCTEKEPEKGEWFSTNDKTKIIHPSNVVCSSEPDETDETDEKDIKECLIPKICKKLDGCMKDRYESELMCHDKTKGESYIPIILIILTVLICVFLGWIVTKFPEKSLQIFSFVMMTSQIVYFGALLSQKSNSGRGFLISSFLSLKVDFMRPFAEFDIFGKLSSYLAVAILYVFGMQGVFLISCIAFAKLTGEKNGLGLNDIISHFNMFTAWSYLPLVSAIVQVGAFFKDSKTKEVIPVYFRKGSGPNNVYIPLIFAALYTLVNICLMVYVIHKKAMIFEEKTKKSCFYRALLIFFGASVVNILLVLKPVFFGSLSIYAIVVLSSVLLENFLSMFFSPFTLERGDFIYHIVIGVLKCFLMVCIVFLVKGDFYLWNETKIFAFLIACCVILFLTLVVSMVIYFMSPIEESVESDKNKILPEEEDGPSKLESLDM